LPAIRKARFGVAMLLFYLSLITAFYWVFFAIFIFFDLYLTYPAVSAIVFPVTRVIGFFNFMAVIYCIARFKNYKKNVIVASLILFVIPFIGIVCFFVWLFFGFRM